MIAYRSASARRLTRCRGAPGEQLERAVLFGAIDIARRMIDCIAQALGPADGAVDQRRSSVLDPGYTIGAANDGGPS
jgi:hypothetical protein